MKDFLHTLPVVISVLVIGFGILYGSAFLSAKEATDRNKMQDDMVFAECVTELTPSQECFDKVLYKYKN